MMIDRQVAPVWAVCLVALAAGGASCADRGKMAAEVPDAGQPDAGELDPREALSDLFRGLDTGPLYLHVVGQRDTYNFYDSTVKIRAVSVPDGPQYRPCSGVLIASNLALTAAHCLCAPTHGQTIRFDGSNCAAKADVKIRTRNPRAPDDDTESFVFDLTGSVLIHPQFETVLDAKRGVTGRADLALVRLDEPMPLDIQIEPARLATKDVRREDVVIVAGFGVYYGDMKSLMRAAGHLDAGVPEYASEIAGLGLDILTRHSSQESVQDSAGDDRYFFGLEKDARFLGDTGGPCLRETKRGQELVGISQRGLGLKSTLTRIVPYRKWLEEQIRLAGGKH